MADDETVRKIFTLPRSLADAIARFQKSRGLPSESAAIRNLIETGLVADETAEELAERCAAAARQGNSMGWIFQNILLAHPRVTQVVSDNSGMGIDFAGKTWIALTRNGKWSLQDLSAPNDELGGGE